MGKAEAEKKAKALEHLNLLLRDNPHLTRWQAIEQTAVRFNLSPLEEDWLLQQLTRERRPE